MSESSLSSSYEAESRPLESSLDSSLDSSLPQISERLLIVDDDRAVRDAVQLLMTTIGFDVVSVDNGQTAVDLFEKPQVPADRPIDCAIIDVSMPGMDGIETVQRIRDIHPALPIILATGYTDKAIPDEMMAQRNTALVRKPYRSESILQVLESLK